MKEFNELLSFVESACSDDGSNHAAALYHFSRIRTAYRKYKLAPPPLVLKVAPKFSWAKIHTGEYIEIRGKCYVLPDNMESYLKPPEIEGGREMTGAKVYTMCMRSSASRGDDDAHLWWIREGAEIVKREDYDIALKRIQELEQQLGNRQKMAFKDSEEILDLQNENNKLEQKIEFIIECIGVF
jgi:hypothetical protein